MYTALEEAKEEVWKRWNNAELRRRVLEYVGELPEGFGDEPRAFLVRHLATKNLEFQAFVKKSNVVGLEPVYTQYTGDKFCSLNPDKRALGKVTFDLGKGKNNGDKIVSHTIIDFCTEDGKPLREVRTIWGENFVAFHHRMLLLSLPAPKLIEFTAWFQKMGGKPELFYHRLIALFICHGIMFENFLSEGDEGKFTRKIVRPAIQKVSAHFGLKPLIVRLRPEETEADPYWCWYPGHLEAEVKILLAGGEAAARLHATEGVKAVLTQDYNPAWK